MPNALSFDRLWSFLTFFNRFISITCKISRFCKIQIKPPKYVRDHVFPISENSFYERSILTSDKLQTFLWKSNFQQNFDYFRVDIGKYFVCRFIILHSVEISLKSSLKWEYSRCYCFCLNFGSFEDFNPNQSVNLFQLSWSFQILYRCCRQKFLCLSDFALF